MRIREPRERWVGFIILWATLFGGVPMLMLVSALGGAQVDGPIPLLALFPTIAGVVLVVSLRRHLRGGFVFGEDGIRGAHDLERGLVRWQDVSHLEWRYAGPTSTMRVNDEPLPSGPTLFAVLVGGDAVRLMQRCVPAVRQQRRMLAQLDAADTAGVLRVEIRGDPATAGPGWSLLAGGDEGTGAVRPDGGRPVEVTRWSSSGRGREVPQPSSPVPSASASTWPAGDEVGDPVVDDRGVHGDDPDEPTWPTG